MNAAARKAGLGRNDPVRLSAGGAFRCGGCWAGRGPGVEWTSLHRTSFLWL